jgi:peptidoglycan/xylan/chitin deacetylase (PgdA/CDA1 family)
MEFWRPEQSWFVTSWRLMTAFIAVLGLSLAGTSARAAEMCWSSAELRHNPGDERVIQGTERALVSAPTVAPGAMMKSPFSWRGALRRVDLPPGQNLIALTFDLCEQPHEVAGYQGDVVDLLRDQNVKATFFLGGKWMLTHQQRAHQLMADPLFEVANHAWEHRNLRILVGTSALDDEIIKPQLAYRQLRQQLKQRMCLARGGSVPAYTRTPENLTLFRFPFGACNPKSLEAVEALGLRAIQWDVSSADPWIGQTPDKMVHDVVSHVRPGSIVLFHANGRGHHTGKALPAIVAALRAKGYKFVTVTELLRTPGARPVVSDLCYDSRPGDTDRYDALARKLAVQHAQAVKRILERKSTPAPPAPDVRPGSTRAAPAAAPKWESSVLPETFSPK